MTSPLMPHLLDILSDPASEGLILAGGFGIQLKQEYLIQSAVRTLISEVPPVRATKVFDFFLRLELFVHEEQGKAARDLLDRLAYQLQIPQ